jgi:hypothetical protein
MPIVRKLTILLLAGCVVIAAMPTTGAARPFAVNATPAGGSLSNDQEQQTPKAESKADSEEESAEDEPAALKLVSPDS